MRLRSADPLAPPRIAANYLSDPDGSDLRVLLRGVRLAQRVLGARGLAPFVGDPIEPGPDVRTDADLVQFIRDVKLVSGVSARSPAAALRHAPHRRGRAVEELLHARALVE